MGSEEMDLVEVKVSDAGWVLAELLDVNIHVTPCRYLVRTLRGNLRVEVTEDQLRDTV